jgi:transcriptional regulator with XRE-family HTH domain
MISDKMFLMENNFAEWLVFEALARDWTQADLARKSGLNRAVISKILSDKSDPSPETCKALARALKLPIEEVYRAAGLLPPIPEADENIKKAENYFRNYKPETVQRALVLLEVLRIEEEKGEYVTKLEDHPAPSETG